MGLSACVSIRGVISCRYMRIGSVMRRMLRLRLGRKGISEWAALNVFIVNGLLSNIGRSSLGTTSVLSMDWSFPGRYARSTTSVCER